MSFRTNALLAGLTLVAVGLSACGDDDDAPLTAASGGKAGAAGAAGGKAGAAGTTSGGSAGSTTGGSAGATSGGSAGSTTGGSAGTTSGGSAGTTAGSAGSTAGSAGSSAGSAGAAGAAAGSGGAAGSAAGSAGSAGATAGGSAGSAAGGAAGSGDAGAAGTAAGGAAGSAGAGGGDDGPVPNFAAIALGPNGDVYRFDTNNPMGAAKSSAVTAGLGGAPIALVGIDYRPSDGLLYGATNTTLFQLAPGGLLGNNLVGSSPQTFTPDLGNAGQGFDFNPAATISMDGSGNPLRIVGYADASNSRYNPTNGKRLGADTKLKYADAANTNQPQVAGSAYTNNIQGTTSTKLYALDGRTDALLQQDPPNDGVLTQVAPLGVDVTDLAGFDIVSVVGPDSVVNNYGFAVIGDSLYTVRLTAGSAPAAKLVGQVAGSSQLRGLAVSLAPK